MTLSGDALSWWVKNFRSMHHIKEAASIASILRNHMGHVSPQGCAKKREKR